MKKTLPEWCKEVKKSLIDRDMSTSEFAEELGLSRTYVSNVINGTYNSPEMRDRICNYLGISVVQE